MSANPPGDSPPKRSPKNLAEIDVLRSARSAGSARRIAPGPGGARAAGAGRFERTAVAIVLLAFGLVVEDVERGLHFLEFFFRVFVVGMQIGMVLARQLAVGLLDIGRRRVAAHTQGLVIIFGH